MEMAWDGSLFKNPDQQQQLAEHISFNVLIVARETQPFPYRKTRVGF